VPPLTMQIGNHILSNISFVTPVSVQESLPSRHEDGLLPTVLSNESLLAVAVATWSSTRSDGTFSRLTERVGYLRIADSFLSGEDNTETIPLCHR
jgi:hypothetical protein